MVVCVLREIVEQVLLNDNYLEKTKKITIYKAVVIRLNNDNIAYKDVNLFWIMNYLNINIIIKSMFWSRSETFFNVKLNEITWNKNSKQA